MAKTLKEIMTVSIESDNTGAAYGKCIVSSKISSTDDTALEKMAVKEYTLSGQDLTDATNLYNSCKAKVETDEGVQCLTSGD